MLRLLLLLGTFAAPAAADPARLGSDAWPVQSRGTLVVDTGFLAGFPAALPTGLARGVGAGATVAHGGFRFGARAGWVTATESTLAWEVTHSDLQVRALGGVEHVAGRGKIGLRIGVGGTLVHESRRRAQGERAGLEGEELEMTAFALLPAVDLEATVGLAVFGPWQVTLAGGPSVALIDGEPRASWVAQIGIGWQP
jgi:hypothetical protein